MPEVQELRCKTCDAVLDLSAAKNGVIECAFCHNTYTVPKEEARNDTRELLAIASHELDTCSFDRAYTAYSKAAELDASEPEAYFGMALATFKVQYLKDANRKHLQPICHDVGEERLADDKNYKKALSLATAAQKKIYTARAEEIDGVRKEFGRLRDRGVHYDCFICVKVTDKDDKGNQINTQDSYEALKLYNHLKKRGYSPFYSEEEIRGKAGAEYEATILYALYTAECMLVVCSNDEYLQTPWVKNEYTRFMELINDERKDSDSITIVFCGKPIERLPGKRALIQGVNLSNADAYTSIEDFVESHTPQAKKLRAQAAKEKARQEEEIRRQIEEQKKAQRELEEKLKNIQTMSVAAAPTQSAGASATVSSLLIRAKQEKKDGNTARAREYYEKVIDADPQNGEAWWGMFLLDMNAADGKAVLSRMDYKLHDDVIGNRNYRNACEYASGDIKTTVDKFSSDLKDPMKWYARFIAEMGGKNEKDALEKITQVKFYAAPKSRNLAIAEMYATPDVKEHIAYFRDRLDSSDTYFQLFLEALGVKNESVLLEKITESSLKKIAENDYFKKALKGQDKASPEYKKRIGAFYDALYGVETEWQLFLRDFDVDDENELFDKYYFDMRSDIEDNEHYMRARGTADSDECDPEMRDRIFAFETRLCSPRTAWQILLAQFAVGSGNALADKMEPKDVELLDKGSNTKEQWINEYYNEIARNADGKTREEFDAFDKKIHSFEHWHRKLIKILAAKDETDYLENKFSYVNVEKALHAALVAAKYATKAADKTAIDGFVKELKRRKELTDKAVASWAKVYKSFDVLNDDGLRQKTYGGRLKLGDQVDVKEALKCAAEANDKKLVERFNSVIAEQESRVAGDRRASKKKTIGKVFTVIAIGLPALMLLTAILGALGVSPLWELWAAWYALTTSDAGLLAIPILLGIVLIIATAIMAVKQNGKKPFVAMRVLSIAVSVVIFAVGIFALPGALSGTGKAYLTDKCLICYEENEAGYTIKKFEYTDRSRTSFEIPREYNGKKVTEIGNRAFEGCETLESITIPDTVKVIGNAAFLYCSRIKEVNIPEGVEQIGSSAFDLVDDLETVTIPKSVIFIGKYAFTSSNLKKVIFQDPTGWGTIPSADLADPQKAAQLLTNTYLRSDLIKTVYAPVQKNGLIKLDKARLVILEQGGRTYYKENSELAYAALVYSTASYTGPLLVGTTATSVEYNWGSDTVVKSQGSFEYNGKTYYYSEGTGYMRGDNRENDRGIYACENRDLLEAAKEIAALIETN